MKSKGWMKALQTLICQGILVLIPTLVGGLSEPHTRIPNKVHLRKTNLPKNPQSDTSSNFKMKSQGWLTIT